MMKRTLLATLLTLAVSCAAVYAQSDTTGGYYRTYTNRFTVKGFLINNFLSLIETHDSNELTYKSNRPVGIGVGFFYKNYGLNVSYGLDFLHSRQKGRTKSLDLQYSYYSKDIVVDLIGQWHKGFYLDNRRSDGSYQLYPDMSMLRIGISAFYVFNGEDFSFRAVQQNTQKQHRSAGTLVVGGSVDYLVLDRAGSPSEHFGRTSHSLLIGPSVGYFYCWVPWKDFYAAIGATVGINAHCSDEWNLTPSLVPRIGVGYDPGRWVVYLTYKNSLIYPFIRTGDRQGISSGSLVLGAAWRFG